MGKVPVGVLGTVVRRGVAQGSGVHEEYVLQERRSGQSAREVHDPLVEGKPNSSVELSRFPVHTQNKKTWNIPAYR